MPCDISSLCLRVGVAGLCTYFSGKLKSLLLTDGSPAAVSMASKNILWHGLQDIVQSRVLRWGTELGDLQCAYDVVIGCELMYYRVEVTALISAVRSLLREGGLFLHAHIFRRAGLEEELMRHLDTIGWSTLEIPLRESVDRVERQQHPDWHSVRCLVSGPAAVVAELGLGHTAWVSFEESISDSVFDSEGDASGGDEEGLGLGGLYG